MPAYKIVKIEQKTGYSVKFAARKALKEILAFYKARACKGYKNQCKWQGKDGIQVYEQGHIIKFRIVEE